MIQKKFCNIECDLCHTMLDEENWYDEEVLTTILSDNNWIQAGGKHYCPDCWEYDDEDNIVTKDGRKFTEDGKLIEQTVNPDEVQDGDIIAGGGCIAIYKGIDSKRKYGGTNKAIIYYACTNVRDGHTNIGPHIGVGTFEGLQFHRAYSEERDLLFARLKAMGYKWSDSKKHLIKED